MKENDNNPYKEAHKNQIITHKDYLIVDNGVVCDLDGVQMDFVEVYHDKIPNQLVGYYIPDGYNSIRVHFNMNMGLKSLLKYINKISFDIGFLNKDKDFDEIMKYCKFVFSYMLSEYNVYPKEEYMSNIITRGYDTTEDEYIFNSVRKFYFTDNKLTGEDRKRIALINTNKNRSKTTRAKVEGAIEYLIQGDSYISQKEIAEYLNVTVRTVRMNLTLDDKKRISQRNTELTGCPTMNEYIKNKNIDSVIDSYMFLKDKGIKPTSVNISKNIEETQDHKVHRVTVSKILKDESVIKLIM